MKWRPVEVKWIDSATRSSWHVLSGKDSFSQIRTVGFLVKKDKNCISVALSMDEDKWVSDTISIPRKCIIKITLLKEI